VLAHQLGQVSQRVELEQAVLADRLVVEDVTKLYKDGSSGGNGCLTVYLGESGELIVQGHMVDEDTFSELESVFPGEGAVRISPEVVLGAIEPYRESGQR
jgi:hypothetical protein